MEDLGDEQKQVQQFNILECNMVTANNVSMQELFNSLVQHGFVRRTDDKIDYRKHIADTLERIPLTDVVKIGKAAHDWLDEAELDDELLDTIAFFDQKPSALASFYVRNACNGQREKNGIEPGDTIDASLFAVALDEAKGGVQTLLSENVRPRGRTSWGRWRCLCTPTPPVPQSL